MAEANQPDCEFETVKEVLQICWCEKKCFLGEGGYGSVYTVQRKVERKPRIRFNHRRGSQTPQWCSSRRVRNRHSQESQWTFQHIEFLGPNKIRPQ